MITKRAIGLGFVGVAVLASSSYCQRKAAKPPVPGLMNNVSVVLDNACTANPDPVTIHVQDQVSWTAKDQAYKVLFSDSPFTNIQSGTPFPVPMGQASVSGAVLPNVQKACSIAPCNYKYTVSGSSGCTNDPRVIIKP